MSWLFSRALVVEYSVDTSLDGAPCAQLNVMPTPHKFWRNDKTMEFCDLSRFGLTLQLLTAIRGEELLMLFLAGFHVRTLASQGVAVGLKVSEADCGGRWPASFAKYSPDSYSWKTPQHSLLGGLDEFSETWPRWGLMRSGECWELDTSALGICGNEFGYLLPTIVKSEYRGTSAARFRGSKAFRGAKMAEGLRKCSTDPAYLNPLFAELAMWWPITWTGLAPLEMDKFQQWRRQHGRY